MVLPKHDELALETASRHGGQVVRSRGEGDSLFIVFTSASDAVAAAVEFQRSILSELKRDDAQLIVRMGLHSGEVDVRDGDYYGSAVNRAARIRALAHGGQILLSDVVRTLAEEQMPPGAETLDLGFHRLRDLEQSERIFQLLHPDLPSQFPPTATQSTPPNNLPKQLSSFIGRKMELRDIDSLLRKNRLLTLTGAGGTGKTRLSLELASGILDQGTDSVWFVELAPISDPSQATPAVAEAMHLQEVPSEPILKTLLSSLGQKPALLLLDNCEHLLDPVAKLVDAILRTCPGVKVLATSREPLGVAGESAYRVPSLSVPDPNGRLTPQEVLQYDSVKLFVERAVASKSDFAITSQNASAVASVCRSLDGIPLALELAASRIRAMSVQQIESRLHSRFALLTGGSRTALPRHQTLGALIDWSYGLLDDREKLLLRRLSVFSGGWRLDSAEATCGGEGIERSEMLDLTTSLVDKSLVVFEENDDRSRYRLLETVRQYALNLLEENREDSVMRTRHRDSFIALVEQAEPNLRGQDQSKWLERLDEDYENIRVALDWSVSEGGSSDGLALCRALSHYWLTRGFFAEGREWCLRVLNRTGSESRTPERASMLCILGNLATRQCDFAGARSYCRESLDIAREREDLQCVAKVLNVLGLAAAEEADYSAARRYYSDSLTIRRELGDLLGVSASLANLAVIARYEKDFTAAKTYLEECLAIGTEIGFPHVVSRVHDNLGRIAVEQGDYSEARRNLEGSIRIYAEVGDQLGICESLDAFAWLAFKLGRNEQSIQLWGAAEALREKIGSPMSPVDQDQHKQAVEESRRLLSSDVFSESWMKGLSMTLKEALELAVGDSTLRPTPV